jgi:hypothetical protein
MYYLIAFSDKEKNKVFLLIKTEQEYKVEYKNNDNATIMDFSSSKERLEKQRKRIYLRGRFLVG